MAKAADLLGAMDGLQAVRGEFAYRVGLEVPPSLIAGKILLTTGADVSASSIKAALELVGAPVGSKGIFDDELHDCIGSEEFRRVRERLLELTGRETGPPPPANR